MNIFGKTRWEKLRSIAFATFVALIVLVAIYGPRIAEQSGAADAEKSAERSRSDRIVNQCGELSAIAENAMRNRQRGVPLSIAQAAVIQAAPDSAHARAQLAAVQVAYEARIDESPSNIWGRVQTACIQAAP